MEAFGILLTVLYLGVIGYSLYLFQRFVLAHERGADALERLAPPPAGAPSVAEPEHTFDEA